MVFGALKCIPDHNSIEAYFWELLGAQGSGRQGRFLAWSGRSIYSSVPTDVKIAMHLKYMKW